MKSLEEASMLAILKLGIGRDELPEILKEEIDRYESMVVATLTGEFSAEPLGFSIGWHEGIKTLCLCFTNDGYENNREVVHVESARLSTLGQFACCQFAILVQEEVVTVEDFFVDLEARKISLLGTSVGENTTDPVRIVISFNPEGGILLSIESVVGKKNPVLSAYFDGWNHNGEDYDTTDEEDYQH